MSFLSVFCTEVLIFQKQRRDNVSEKRQLQEQAHIEMTLIAKSPCHHLCKIPTEGNPTVELTVTAPYPQGDIGGVSPFSSPEWHKRNELVPSIQPFFFVLLCFIS